MAEPIFDEVLHSSQIEELFSKIAKTCRKMGKPPQDKYDRAKFLSAIGRAFEEIGGVNRFAIWADKNPTEFYKLCGKTIPQATMLDIYGKLQHIIKPALPPSALDEGFIEGEVVNPPEEKKHG